MHTVLLLLCYSLLTRLTLALWQACSMKQVPSPQHTPSAASAASLPSPPPLPCLPVGSREWQDPSCSSAFESTFLNNPLTSEHDFLTGCKHNSQRGQGASPLDRARHGGRAKLRRAENIETNAYKKAPVQYVSHALRSEQIRTSESVGIKYRDSPRPLLADAARPRGLMVRAHLPRRTLRHQRWRRAATHT